MENKIYSFIIVLLMIVSCSKTDAVITIGSGTGSGSGSGSEGGSSTWLIPVNEVHDGGPGKDGIPSLDTPIFLEHTDASIDDYMTDDELVVGVFLNNEARAYPYKILNWHEVVNDEIGEHKFTISYCPLTGTAFGWEGLIRNDNTQFGVSGLLYNSNLILYDRKTNSNWSQIGMQCVNGPAIGQKPTIFDVVETTWAKWKQQFPTSKILSDEQGFPLRYNNYPYGPYREDHSYFLFPFSIENPAIPNKERVHVVYNDKSAKVYQFNAFTNNKIFRDSFLGKEILVIGDQDIIYSFELTSETTNLVFEYEPSSLGYFFTDNEGNKWTVFGEVIEGPRKGVKLIPVTSFMSYWFAVPPFFSDIEIY